MTTTLYHNPRCSKSREALTLLRARGIEPVIREYLKAPPDHATLKDLLKKLGIGARDLMRVKEPPYKNLGLGNPDLDENTLIDAMVMHPVLIERPILVVEERAVIGRPPENILTIL